MRRGVRVAVDVGSVRVGVARCDPDGLVATPVETVAVPAGEELVTGATRRSDLLRIGTIVDELAALEVLVGLPRSLSGREGPSAAVARKYAVEIARLVAPVPVRLVDERFSSVSAGQRLREAGVTGRRARPVVDQLAAVVFLQAALDGERATGRLPGAPVAPGSEVTPSDRGDGQEAGGR